MSKARYDKETKQYSFYCPHAHCMCWYTEDEFRGHLPQTAYGIMLEALKDLNRALIDEIKELIPRDSIVDPDYNIIK